MQIRYNGPSTTAVDLRHNAGVLRAELDRVTSRMSAIAVTGAAVSVDDYVKAHTLARTISDLEKSVQAGAWGG